MGCINLTLVTVVVGFFSQGTQAKLSDKALGIYDNAFQSMNYLRSAQSIVLGVSRDIAVGERNNAIFIDQLQSALDALDFARERAMSRSGEDLAQQLLTSVSSLQAMLSRSVDTPARSTFLTVEKAFDEAVSGYASDGLQLRRSAEDLVHETRLQTYAAMLGSVLIALVITLLLTRAIVPSIRRAVAVATAVASGKLDNRIEGHGRSETGLLLKALSTMQDCIADKIGFIETLMAQQASSHNVEIAAHNARFETALNHLTLGLRMYDGDGSLVVQNRRFDEMFETEASLRELTDFLLAPPVPDSTGSRHYLTSDDRTIEVAQEAMTGGGRVVTYDDVTERRRTEDRLSQMARHDALTGLPNRILFREHLQRETRLIDLGTVLSVLCLDLDRFKLVNDTLGHPVGDTLLRDTAARLLRNSGDTGVVVRLGGDEFAVVHKTTDGTEDARGLAGRLIEVLNEPFEVDGHRISIGVSIGIAEAAQGTESPDELLKNADLALYSAKVAGGGGFRIFEPEMNERMQIRRQTELDLRVAIAEQQFQLHYQPIVSAGTGAVVSFEALLRWHHPHRGMVSPADFIPLAEEAGLIPIIGKWALQRACRDAVAWPDDIKVAVNLSPLQFQYRNLVDDVEEALQQSSLPATRLDLEITESLMLQNSEATLSTLHALRELGIGISMDDFGTGYSSLSYLRQFPFDKIKIDRSFVQDVVDNKDGLAIVEAVINLGRSLRMNVVAEGVETIEQRNLLCEAGCQELQGYFFSRPQPIDKIDAFIHRMAEKNAA